MKKYTMKKLITLKRNIQYIYKKNKYINLKI